MGEAIETWKRIAVELQRSERWVRYMSIRAHDPLPVFKVGGIVRLNGVDLDAWISRQRASGLPRSVATPSIEEHW